METYRGWTPEVRMQGLAKVKSAMADGVLQDPNTMPCIWCKTTDGLRQWHQEQYGNPLFPGPMAMCIPCHMVLHVGERDPVFRSDYRLAVHFGYQPPAMRSQGEWFATDKLPEVKQHVRVVLQANRHRKPPESLLPWRGGQWSVDFIRDPMPAPSTPRGVVGLEKFSEPARVQRVEPFLDDCIPEDATRVGPPRCDALSEGSYGRACSLSVAHEGPHRFTLDGA